MKMLDSVPFTVRSWKNATCLQGHFSLNKILRNRLISKNMQWNYLHHSVLPLIISCTRSCNFVWCVLWYSTTESKNIVKPLAISQTFTPCAARTSILQRENLNYLIICFTQCTLFPKIYFLLQICLPCITCGMNVTKINAVLLHRTRQTFAPLGLFRFARIACLLQLWIKTSKLDCSIWASHASVYLTNIVGTWHLVHFGQGFQGHYGTYPPKPKFLVNTHYWD